jgi:hypothetical protein
MNLLQTLLTSQQIISLYNEIVSYKVYVKLKRPYNLKSRGGGLLVHIRFGGPHKATKEQKKKKSRSKNKRKEKHSINGIRPKHRPLFVLYKLGAELVVVCDTNDLCFGRPFSVS